MKYKCKISREFFWESYNQFTAARKAKREAERPLGRRMFAERKQNAAATEKQPGRLAEQLVPEV